MAKSNSGRSGKGGGSYSQQTSTKGRSSRQRNSGGKGNYSHRDDSYDNHPPAKGGGNGYSDDNYYASNSGKGGGGYQDDYGNDNYPDDNIANDNYGSNNGGYSDSYSKGNSHSNDSYDDQDSGYTSNYNDGGYDEYQEDNSGRGSYSKQGYSENEPINDPPPYEDYDSGVSKQSGGQSESYSAKGGGDTSPEADMVFTEEEVYGDSSNDSDADMEFTENEAYGYQGDNNRPQGNEWNRRRGPRAGETLMGHEIRMVNRNGSQRPAVTIDDRVYFITRYGGKRGIFYGGRADQTRSIIRSIAQSNQGPDSAFMQKAIQSYTVLGEGGFSSINTYDNMVFTLGTGLAGRRLNRYLQGLRGTPLGDALNQISYFRGLRFNGSERIRLDIEAIHQVVILFESQQHASLVGEKSVDDYLQNSLKISHSRNRRNIRQWVVDSSVRPEIMGIAAYLCHGRPRYTPVPLNDVARAVRAGGSNLSAQLAALLKLHAQRICLDRDPSRVGGGPSGRQAAAAATRRLPNKVPHFVHAMRASGESNFQFNYDAARSVLPCINPRSWRTTSTRPQGLYLEHEGRYYALGSRIS